VILTISEIVSSIKGEGKNAGYPTTFVKLHGCNLNCSYCRNECRTGKKKKMSVQTVLEYIFKMGNHYVEITGGEPLLQDTTYVLLYDLVDRGYNVTINTNGSQIIEDCMYARSYSYCMEIKCPSSKMESKNVYENLKTLIMKDEVKFLIADVEDYVFAKDIIEKYPTNASYVFSPLVSEDGKHIGKDLAQWLLEDKLQRARLGVPIQTLLGIK
jgi:7-carboxy-7-deazaguanine synthase